MAIDYDEHRRFTEALLTHNSEDYFNTLGIRIVDVGPDGVRMAMDYREELVGDPETGVLHGGAVTSLLDTCSGFAAASALEDLGLTPTIDLRIDYMCSATPGETVYADAEVYRVTEYVMFTRASAHHGDPAKPIACAVGTFFRLKSANFDALRNTFRNGMPEDNAREGKS